MSSTSGSGSDLSNCRFEPKTCTGPDPLHNNGKREMGKRFHKRAPPPPPPPPAPLQPIDSAPTIAPTDPAVAPATSISDNIDLTPTSFSPTTPPAATSTTATTVMAAKNTTLMLTSAVLGSLLLLVALLLFYVCMKRRRHALSCRRRIGQLHDGMPTSSSSLFMDIDEKGGKKSSEKYYYNQHQYHQYPEQQQIDTTSSASTLVAHPSNAHHRTRSAPIAFTFAKGGLRRHSDTSTKSSLNNNVTTMATVSPTTVVGGYGQMGRIGRDTFGGQFQQISLVAEEVEEDDNVSLERSFSTGQGGNGYGYGFGGYGVSSSSNSSRNRSKTVAVPIPVVSTLHRSVSLSTHGHPLHGPGSVFNNADYYNSRSGAHHIDDGEDDDEGRIEKEEGFPHDADHDALPLPTTSRHHQLRFAEGENPHVPRHSHTSSQHQHLQQSYPYPQHIQPSNRYSVGLGYHSHRGSISSAMEFDPSRFSTTSVMFDAKRLFTSSRPVSSSSVSAAAAAAVGGTIAFSGHLHHPHPPTEPDSDDSDDDTVSSSSSDGGFDDLPPHQLSQHFESHNPYAVSNTMTATEDKRDCINGDDDGSESEGESDEAVVQELGFRRQHGYPVYGQTISPLSHPPMPSQISPE